jgi:hypothetical protein
VLLWGNEDKRNALLGLSRYDCAVAEADSGTRHMPATKTNLAHLRAQIGEESAEGSHLLDSPADNPICDIYYDPAVPCAAITWKRYATSAQLRFIAESVIVLLQQHGTDKFLADVTGLPSISAEDQIWVVEDWMPRAVAAGLRVIAGKNPASYFGKLSADHIVGLAPNSLNICFFDALDEARAWLKNIRPF